MAWVPLEAFRKAAESVALIWLHGHLIRLSQKQLACRPIRLSEKQLACHPTRLSEKHE
jgi:hypothetical protein